MSEQIVEANSVFEYLEKVKELDAGWGTTVYRGEPRTYPRGCMPNIFRNEEMLLNPDYERNVLEKVRAQKIDVENDSYLITAIEAQHGGFPSRLLDVSYNALIALNFAVSPYYMEKIDVYDSDPDKESKQAGIENDGVVFMIHADKTVSPMSKNITKIYEEMITSTGSRYDTALYSRFFIFLDHYKKNPRINAQQGAFILFGGRTFESIPQNMMRKIRIPREAKKTIREELSRYFGISNSYIYPEPDVYSKTLGPQTFINFNFEFNIENEIGRIFEKVDQSFNIAYYELKGLYDKENSEIIKIITELDKKIKNFEFEMNDFLKNSDDSVIANPELVSKLQECLIPINKQIKDFNIAKSIDGYKIMEVNIYE